MNAKRYRLIFSKRLGMLVPVAEIATRAKKGSAGDHGDGMGVTLVPKLNSFCVAMLMTAGIGMPVSGRAQVVPDGTTQTTMTQSSNGKPMVDIANPTGVISHNRFTEFNVDSQGLLLNNSMQNTGTQTGGMVMLNPHLTQAATGIVAEVTGTNISRLQGAMEIAGQKADLIIANPNGMYLNGLSIINAGSLGLTTGTPDASRTRFDVHGGHIDIDGNVSTEGLDHFDVVARSIRLNGRVTGGDTLTRLAAGLNTFDTENRRVDKREDSGANAPAVAILGTEAGFMHGRHVTLQSTESGLGVRHEGSLTSTANIKYSGNLSWSRGFALGSRRIDLGLRSGWQWTSRNLLTANTLSIGDEYTVRGFKGNGAFGDVGGYLSTTVTVPIAGGWSAFTGIDYGALENNLPDARLQELSGWAVGLRGNWRNASVSLMHAEPLTSPGTAKDPVLYGMASLRF